MASNVNTIGTEVKITNDRQDNAQAAYALERLQNKLTKSKIIIKVINDIAR